MQKVAQPSFDFSVLEEAAKMELEGGELVCHIYCCTHTFFALLEFFSPFHVLFMSVLLMCNGIAQMTLLFAIYHTFCTKMRTSKVCKYSINISNRLYISL